MPPSYTQQAATFRAQTLPGVLPVGKLFDQPNGGSNSIWANMFRNQVKNGDPGYTREDAQMITGAEAYFGQTQVISDTVMVMTLTDMNWLTKVISPWRLMDETTKSFTWNSTKFKPHIATEVPHLGIVRLVKSERTSAKVSIKRWGMGYAMEHDFMNTREGLRYHLAHLQQMSNSILEAVKHDILYTLLDAYSFERRYIKEKKLYKNLKPEDYFRQQAWMFASLQKEKHAIEKLDAEINERLYKWRGVANTWIMPPQIIRYLSQVPPENITYSEAGPAGPQRLLDGPAPWGVLAKQPVYIARAFYTDQLSANNSLLEDNVELGEHYRMSDPAFDPDCPYRSRHRNIMIYNFPDDAFREIGLKFALDNCNLFSDKGAPVYLTDKGTNMQYSSYIADVHDRQRDYFTYCSNLDGKYTYTNALMMGELELFYWNVEDKIHQAISGMNAIADKMGHGVFAKVMQDLTAGKALVDQIASLPFTREVEGKLIARYGPQGGNTGPSPRGMTSIHSLGNNLEVRQNAITGFAQRQELFSTLGPMDELYPGFQSFPGLVEIAAVAPDTLPEKRIAADAVQAIRLLVSYIKDLYPDSIFVSPAFSSPHWWFPSAEITFFENFIHKGNNPPTFYSNVEDASGISQLPTTGLDTAAYLYNHTKEINIRLPDALKIEGDAQSPAGSIEKAFSYYLRGGLLLAAGFDRNAIVEPGVVAAIQKELGIKADRSFDESWTPANKTAAKQKATEALVRLANQYPETGYGRFKNLPDYAAYYVEEIEKLFNDALTKEGASRDDLVDPSQYVRSPILASSTFMTTLYNAGNADVPKLLQPSGKIVVAEPIYPEQPIASRDRLDTLTRAYSQRGGQTQQQIDMDPGHLTVDSSLISADLPMGTNTMFMNVMSASIGLNLASETRAAPRPIQMSIGQAHGDRPEESAPTTHHIRSRTAQAAQLLMGGMEVSTRRQRHAMSEPLKRLISYGERFLSANFSDSWRLIEEQAQNPLVLALAHIYDGTPIHKKAFTSFIENNIRLPLDFIITRPHISLRQLTAIKMQAGSETMFTAVAPGQFELADDAAVQGHIGTLTSKHKAVCTTPENVYINKGIFINGVNGGLGLHAIDPMDYNCGKGNFAGQDIIVVPVAKRDIVEGSLFSLTGDLSVAELEGLGLTGNKHLQYETAERMNRLYGFREVRKGVSYSETAVDTVPVNNFANVLCMPGTFIQCNPRENKFNIVVQGQSMLGGLIYPGCAAVLCGKMTEVNRNPWTSYLQY
jgi:hypothetical protein